LLILVIPSVLSGYLFKPFFISLGSHFFQNAIFFNYYNLSLNDFEFLTSYQKLIPLIISFLGIIFSFILIGYFYKQLTNLIKNQVILKSVYIFLNKK
jgi:hypothetical protein